MMNMGMRSRQRYAASGSSFGGSTYALRGGNLTGVSDGKQFTFSAWFKPASGTDGQEMQIIDATGTSFFLRRDTSNRLDLIVRDTSAAIAIRMITSDTYTAGVWHHVMIAANTASNTCLFYVDDAVPSFSVDTQPSNQTLDFTPGEWAIGSRTATTSKWEGCLAEVYWQDDFSNLALDRSRLEFILLNGRPAYLGQTGEKPTGTAAKIYAPNGDASDNKGTGGDFTLTGTLSACDTRPAV